MQGFASPTAYVDDRLPTDALNSLNLTRHISDRWGGYTVLALALRELQATIDYWSEDDLKRIRGYLVAQRSECGADDRPLVNQLTLLIDLLDRELS